MYRSKFRNKSFVDFPVIDYHLHILLAKDGDLGYINAVLGGYRVNSETSILLNNNSWVVEGIYHSLLASYQSGANERDISSAVGMFLCDRFVVALQRFNLKYYHIWSTRISENFSRKIAGKEAIWEAFEGLGYTGTVSVALPRIAKSQSNVTDLMNQSPSLEYDFYAFNFGEVDVVLQAVPTHALYKGKGVRCAVSIDDATPVEYDQPLFLVDPS